MCKKVKKKNWPSKQESSSQDLKATDLSYFKGSNDVIRSAHKIGRRICLKKPEKRLASGTNRNSLLRGGAFCFYEVLLILNSLLIFVLAKDGKCKNISSETYLADIENHPTATDNILTIFSMRYTRSDVISARFQWSETRSFRRIFGSAAR